MGKFDQGADAIENGGDHAVGCVRVVLCNVGTDFVNIVEGFRVESEAGHADGGCRRACVFSIKRR